MRATRREISTTFEEAEEFARDFLQAWADKDVAAIMSYYADDCLFISDHDPDGLKGSDQIRAYIENLFAQVPAMSQQVDKVWLIEGGMCIRSFAQLEGGPIVLCLDLLLLDDRKIAYNESYNHMR